MEPGSKYSECRWAAFTSTYIEKHHPRLVDPEDKLRSIPSPLSSFAVIHYMGQKSIQNAMEG
jgi:hypothetical protein